MIKRDNYITGFLIAVITPLVFYAVLLGFDYLFVKTFGKSMVRAPHYLYLLAVTPNLIWARYYLGKLKFTKSGFSILLVTIVFVLTYFFKYFQNV